jgi:hypothetical protein
VCQAHGVGLPPGQPPGAWQGGQQQSAEQCRPLLSVSSDGRKPRKLGPVAATDLEPIITPLDSSLVHPAKNLCCRCLLVTSSPQHPLMSSHQLQPQTAGAQLPALCEPPAHLLQQPTALSEAAMAAWATHTSSSSNSSKDPCWQGMPASPCTMRLHRHQRQRP